MNHGGEGKKIKARSDYSLLDIEVFLKNSISDLILAPDNEDKTHYYFVYEFYKEIEEKGRKPFRIILCKDKEDDSLGLITLYQLN